MTERQKYEEVQRRLKKKIIPLPTNKQEEYNKGIRSAMSIVKDVYGLPERKDHEF